jgi:hypothetical protein
MATGEADHPLYVSTFPRGGRLVRRFRRRMSTPIHIATLDRVLALQLTVAWAGEGPRLRWWPTDLVDVDAGGDFFARLVPRTAVWAALEAAREVARRTDAKMRREMPDADRMRTLFFLGFDADEKLGDRLAMLKRSGSPPTKVLAAYLPVDLAEPFNSEALSTALGKPDRAPTCLDGGRQMAGVPPAALEALASRLAAALVPLADRYPLPFYRIPS